MIAGIIAGITWAVETIVLGIALSKSAFIETDQAVLLAPFVSTFLHDAFSAIWACMYNAFRGNLSGVIKALKTKMDDIYQELLRLTSSNEANEQLLETINLVARIYTDMTNDRGCT